MDAFISHSSADADKARRVEQTLEADNLAVWLDRSEIRPGRLLRAELQAALRDSRVVILLWSHAAATSRWVAAELLTAFHLNRFIVACVCDKTELPYFLQNTIYLNVAARPNRWGEDLRRAVREAPDSANDIPAKIGATTAELNEAIARLAEGQASVTRAIERNDLKGAKRFQAALDAKMKAAERKWRLEAMILNLAGYHDKNAYLLAHWAAIMAGQPPKDALLDRAERYFYRSLFVDPYDFSALNGLGSILLYERELDAAEFFVRRALQLAEAAGADYAAARHDLQLILALKARNPRPPAATLPPQPRAHARDRRRRDTPAKKWRSH